MALDSLRFSSILIGGDWLHQYTTDDAKATVLAAGYFDGDQALAERVNKGEAVILRVNQAGTPDAFLGVITDVDLTLTGPAITIVAGS